ncbi:dihydrolipoamide acetyltransferase family protein [Sphingosinicella soli]|uniref:Dihydrolipoamide acetyltransferase component of pyruvate dehydrogenase complex n=1 Tax=Sphingosinicella soli TaxID=333708 RepID=A0A7W7B403_9SPHN|nr:dihydrolipoamide acetyltransferase family protein [Sphingosinicella soli]MBB4632640.1 2-oxoisovalerate dehydrogenase E2 component (dihydrolipoyl transacylase) [Sphingosinicella soli]
MANYVFKLPDIGEGIAEAELVEWYVKPGDTVAEDQPLADVMTDKATVELTSPVSGTIVAIHGEVGQLRQIGSALVEFALEGKARAEPVEAAAAAVVPDQTPPPAPASSRPKASPLVRRLAKQGGVNLETVKGSGPHGRIRRPDFEAHVAALRVSPSADEFTESKLVGLRRKIAEKMEISARRIPHFAYVEEADLTALEGARAELNARYGDERPKLTLLPFFVQALVRVLPRFPQINATYDDEAGIVRRYTPVHVGIATQTDNGLIVPVVRNAQDLGLWELAAEIARLAAAARDGTAKRDELSGSTITITSLGTLGGIATTPVINHPEVAIIGPNRLVERPVVRSGAIEVRKMMNVSSSFDHRVVDGYEAARFIGEVKALLESPTLLLAR